MILSTTVVLLVSEKYSIGRLEEFFHCEELPEQRSLADPLTTVDVISILNEELRFYPNSERVDLFVNAFVNSLLGERISKHKGYHKGRV
jgi:hypothetical protein